MVVCDMLGSILERLMKYMVIANNVRRVDLISRDVPSNYLDEACKSWPAQADQVILSLDCL